MVVNRVFSKPDLALAKSVEYFSDAEQNIYVCPVFYPGGVEYHIKHEQDIIKHSSNYIKKIELSPKHHFKTLTTAMKAVKYFRDKGSRYCVKRKFDNDGPYKFVKYYSLCSI